jgi:RNA polymerase sigma factor (sigma-70 family)
MIEEFASARQAEPHRDPDSRGKSATATGTTTTSLVFGAREGSAVAWDEMVCRFTPLLWFVARGYRLSRDDAADAVQMTWLRCVERLDQLRDAGSLAAWLMTVCRRECMIVLRQARAIPHDPLGELAAIPDAVIPDPIDALVEREERAVLEEGISRLPDRPHRVLLALLDAYETGDGYGAIAERLDMPVGSVGPTRLRALDRLRHDPQIRGLARGEPAEAEH